MPVLVSNLQEEVAVPDNLVNLVEKVILETLQYEGYSPGAEVGLIFVDDNYIQSLNAEYRGIDKPTDVLSFALNEGEDMPQVEEAEDLLGDIVISLPTARRQAAAYGHSFEREVAYLTAHGCLHLLGYDHQNEADRQVMRQKEEAILHRLNISR
ncbi:rRNA maturation RNase YbeY [Desulforamulus hydrothermalis]|uniref:Endoribonuclease YbeY n=1 Tax=Desulforamulus hydrothermalis Lam5 = DSM 18033 TaxID=1121428 RepID=K8E0Q4_9FIRM|nr:rRNA maturation RNase YbeY [Desulforamulus hydrothermalis]CCO09100.1 putative rRNA maturation factor [Desulforamulus hydrothermalis Lam5 = DSM 18033]SHH12571.1 probable rRNA maturation factor [Desulforamulus hydrothermalis Lam5 = DSM 18033]